ncbi:hypothetical protein BB561_004076 [Smittium simulii]|uniref:Uncharacterized protein n=1 Tax=Smittium simulii TaxID=133385 RepID=A0A2T9YI46_9FUNG|nr:hypothetical protein BB561_004076 [Smittium simulii]
MSKNDLLDLENFEPHKGIDRESQSASTRKRFSRRAGGPSCNDSNPDNRHNSQERKNSLYSCPKTSSMNYNPPPLNDSASSAVKKTDYALYGIQLVLAQETRPIDYYAHRRIQDNSTLDTLEDPETMFASTMRALLLDIAATVTQARLDNAHKKMDLLKQETVSQKAESPALLQAPAEFGPKECGQQQHYYGVQHQRCNHTGYHF